MLSVHTSANLTYLASMPHKRRQEFADFLGNLINNHRFIGSLTDQIFDTSYQFPDRTDKLLAFCEIRFGTAIVIRDLPDDSLLGFLAKSNFFDEPDQLEISSDKIRAQREGKQYKQKYFTPWKADEDASFRLGDIPSREEGYFQLPVSSSLIKPALFFCEYDTLILTFQGGLEQQEILVEGSKKPLFLNY